MIIYALICVILAVIAHHQDKNWVLTILLSFFLTPIAGVVCLLVMKPDPQKVDQFKAETRGMKKCPQCAEMIRAEARLCRYCGTEQPRPRDIVQEDIDSGEFTGRGYVEGDEPLKWVRPQYKYLRHVMYSQRKKNS